MEFVNAAKHTTADYITAYDKTGQEYLVVVIKATYKIPQKSAFPRPVIPADPLVISDIFRAEEGLSQPLYECDYAYFKPYCDVIINGHAYAPDATTSLIAEAHVAEMKKAIRVIGERTWQYDNGRKTLAITPVKPFTVMPLTYEYAYGGQHSWQEQETEHSECDLNNPVGCGFAKRAPEAVLSGKKLPNLMYPNAHMTQAGDVISACAFSVVPRNAASRVKFAGTYDDLWRKKIAPFLPEDFDERYFQIAAEDQQIKYPTGGESVRLKNLCATHPDIQFTLPRLDTIPVKFLTSDYQVIEKLPVVDTLYIEPDKGQFSVIWRTRVPIKKHIGRYSTIAIGHVSQKWWDDVSTGKAASSCKQFSLSEEAAS